MVLFLFPPIAIFCLVLGLFFELRCGEERPSSDIPQRKWPLAVGAAVQGLLLIACGAYSPLLIDALWGRSIEDPVSISPDLWMVATMLPGFAVILVVLRTSVEQIRGVYWRRRGRQFSAISIKRIALLSLPDVVFFAVLVVVSFVADHAAPRAVGVSAAAIFPNTNIHAVLDAPAVRRP